MVGAVLTQRTAWRNVETALTRLRDAGMDGPERLLALSQTDLEELVRPSGTFRQKATRLRALFSMVLEAEGGSVEGFLDRPMAVLRRDLLSVKGIGPETADSIILYAAGRPAFVVDAYTRRLLARLGVEAGRSYDRVASWFKDGLPVDAPLYNNYHAAIVQVAKEHCRAEPLCQGCPLRPHCLTGLSR